MFYPEVYPGFYPEVYLGFYPESYPEVSPEVYPEVYLGCYQDDYPEVYPVCYPEVYPLTNVSSGGSLSSINAATYPRLRLRANLGTSNTAVTPTLSDWSVTYAE
ncbi:MAG: hypothetical protein QME51_11510, partial [Planctomycetota bacterium]|nr:hypothetical protein [Planctomycetota bacterium]